MKPTRNSAQEVGPAPSAQRFLRVLLAWLTLLFCLFVTGWLWHSNRMQAWARAGIRFREEVGRSTAAIRARLHIYEGALYGTCGLFAANSTVTRKMFHSYVSSLGIEQRYPGIQGIGYAIRISPEKATAHTRKIRQEGFSKYSIWPEGERSEYTSIIYLEPFDWRNQRAFGYDMFTDPVRHAAMEYARDSGRTSISGKVTLVQETVANVQAGFLMYLPVYRREMPATTIEERRASLLGYVYSPFRINDLMKGVINEPTPLASLEISTGTNISSQSLLYSDRRVPDGAGASPALSQMAEIDLGGQPWTLRFSSLPSFDAIVRDSQNPLILPVGVLVSFLVFALIFMFSRTEAKALKLAEAMTAKLRASEGEIKRQNARLEVANRELEAFSYSVAHDLRSPLRAIDGFSLALLEDCEGQLPGEAKLFLQRIRSASARMAHLIDDLLKLARISRYEVARNRVNLSSLAQEVVAQIKTSAPDRQCSFSIAPDLYAFGDENLLRIVLENLLENAWKFTAKQPQARIEMGVCNENGERAFFVRDNGPGFDMQYAGKLFGVFQRLHRDSEFPGNGVGLATIQRIIQRHGGRTWAKAAVGKGATFYFILENASLKEAV